MTLRSKQNTQLTVNDGESRVSEITTEHGMHSAAGKVSIFLKFCIQMSMQFLGLALGTSAKWLGSQRSENAHLCMLTP